MLTQTDQVSLNRFQLYSISIPPPPTLSQLAFMKFVSSLSNIKNSFRLEWTWKLNISVADKFLSQRQSGQK